MARKRRFSDAERKTILNANTDLRKAKEIPQVWWDLVNRQMATIHTNSDMPPGTFKLNLLFPGIVDQLKG